MLSFLSGTPVAGLIVLKPGIKFKAIKGNSLCANRHFAQKGAYLGIKPVAVHTEIGGCGAEPNDAGLKLR